MLGLSGVSLLMAGRLDLGAGGGWGKLPGVAAMLMTALMA